MKKVQTSAPTNIALIKYWGKRDTKRNLPLTSSLSVTLTNMRSWATVQEASGTKDLWEISGDPSKAMRVLSAARLATEDHRPLQVSIRNDFPSSAGLASSASSMAAFAKALGHFLAQDQLPLEQVTTWARLGSGSSVRSFYPGYVVWDAGTDLEGKDCIAASRFHASQLPVSLVVCVVNDGPKPIGSTAAMERSRATSPGYKAFHQKNDEMLQQAIQSLQKKDFERLGQLSEQNCLAMHKVIRESQPPIDYFLPGTHQAIELVRQLRQDNIPAFFTIDAGPNVKILSPPEYQEQIYLACQKLTGVKKILLDQIAEQVEVSS